MLKMLLALSMLSIASLSIYAQWPAPKSPVVPEADGYVIIPRAAIPPDKKRIYRAVYDATHAASDPSRLLPSLNMLGSELNALGATGVPLRNAKFVIVFHGPAVDGILDNAHYKAKFGVDNPNLPALAKIKKAGVLIYVCGQHLAGEKIDPKTLSSDVTVAADALIVLMQYENDGYAFLAY